MTLASKKIIYSVAFSAIAYLLFCTYLYFRQEYLILKPNLKVKRYSPKDSEFQLPHNEIWLNVPDSNSRIHAWWFNAPSPSQPVIALPDEPANILNSPKTVLFLVGRGGSKTYYNSLSRIKGLQQLGFSVLAIDYRGYGLSEGILPNEKRIYEDSETAWQYLTKTKQITPQDIIIYGESLGGAVAIDLAAKHPNAGAVIIQSSFTSLEEQIKTITGMKLIPIKYMLQQKFDSISKVKEIAIPLLFLHGTKDTVVNYQMSQQLYAAAAEPKEIFLIPEGGHFSIYKPGKDSYLLAIEKFMFAIENKTIELNRY